MRKHGRRVLKTVLIVVAGIVALSGASIAGGFALMRHEYSDRTEILKSASVPPRMALVVYQPSVTPASSDVAHAIARGLNDSGFEVKISNPSKHLSADISAYSVIVFGSPNYADSVAEPLLNYVKRIDDFSGKTVVLFSTSGGVGGMPEIERLSEFIHGVKPYSAVRFKFNEWETNREAAYQLGMDAAGQ